MPLIYKPYQATLANKEGQKLFYPRLVKIGRTVNTQKMAELIAEKASLTAGDVHNVIRNLMSVMREQLLNSRTVRLEGLGTFTMIAKAGGKGVELENKVSSSQITSLRCQFTPEYTRAANGSATRALTTGVEFVHIKADNRSLFRGFAIRCLLWYMGNSKKRSARYTIADSRIGVPCRS